MIDFYFYLDWFLYLITIIWLIYHDIRHKKKFGSILLRTQARKSIITKALRLFIKNKGGDKEIKKR